MASSTYSLRFNTPISLTEAQIVVIYIVDVAGKDRQLDRRHTAYLLNALAQSAYPNFKVGELSF